jgi:hypothetical protein
MSSGRKSAAQTPAPKKDRIYGSKTNPKGSASSEKSAKSIVLSDKTMKSLQGKLKEFKEKHPAKKNITLNDLKAVYRRGLGAYSSSHRPTITGGVPNTRNAWAMARVNKFLLKAGGTKVKAAYVQDDDLMKYEEGGLIASNGNPSNLTPEQYKLVRTPEFKAWFGDWENSPETASKVVDENGEPLVVYHGTYVKEQFNVFDFDKADLGFHFGTYEQARERSQTKMNVQGYKSIINPYFLNIRNLVNVHDVGEWEYPQRYIDTLISEGLITEKEAKQNGFFSIYHRDDNKLVREFLINKFGNIGFDYENKIESKGLSYLVLQPNQIKLADGSNTTFDANNPDIRFAEGGELENYSVAIKENGLQQPFEWNAYNSEETIYVPENEIYAFLYDAPNTQDKIDNDALIFSNNRGLGNFWKDLKTQKGSESLVAILKGRLSEDKTKLYILTMTTKNEFRKKGLMSKLIREVRSKYNIDKENVIFIGLTDMGQKMYKKKRYAEGGLIAPNGKPSNLTPEQYKLVRTPEFKAWFGDWENSPETSSKVVDENGEPLVVYHGTRKRFNTFDKSKGYSQNWYGLGFYFTDSKEDIEKNYTSKGKDYKDKVKNKKIDLEVGEYVFDVFLNIKNPLELFNKIGKNKTKILNSEKKIIEKYGYDVEGISIYMNKIDFEISTYWDLENHLRNLSIENENNENIIGEVIRAMYEIIGFDGIIMNPYHIFNELENRKMKVDRETNHYITFYPEQIKLADGTNTTFDANNPDIRFADGGRFDDQELLKKYKAGESIGFTAIAHLKAKGLIARADGTKRKSDKYKEMGGNVDEEIKLPDLNMSYGALKETLNYQGYEIEPMKHDEKVSMQQIAHNDESEFKDGGVVIGKRHSEYDENGSGEKFLVESTGQVVELEGGEGVLCQESMSSDKKFTFEGKSMTGREIASYLNHKYGGVEFAKGGEVKKIDKIKADMPHVCGCKHQYYHGGEVPTAVVRNLKGGEAVVTVKSMESKDQYNFNGKPMTPRQIFSQINMASGGKKFEDGGVINLQSIKDDARLEFDIQLAKMMYFVTTLNQMI